MKLFKREKILKKIRPFYEATDIIKVITGVRRYGKSTVLELIKRELISNGVPASNIIDIDLDSKKYKAIKTSAKLEKVIDDLSFNKEGLLYLFIDEIQNVHDFEEVINAYRGEGNYSIFITGSNSYLLSGELVTKLTGRYLEFELFTLSFDEYVEMKKYFNQNINENLILELQEYIIYGGFPRALLLDEVNAKRTYTSGIVKEIFEKDIKRRVKVRNVHTFEIVTNFIVNNFGATISVNSIRKSLLNTGIRVSHETINRYIQILKDAKIIYECERFDTKSKRALAGEKKYYLADLSFYFMLNTNNEINYGPCLENIVYIYARSLDYAISVSRIGKLECDFILRNNKLDYSYVQVAYTILSSKETLEREYRPLEAIKDNYAKYVLTTDYLLQKRGGIIHANIMDFMTSHQLF